MVLLAVSTPTIYARLTPAGFSQSYCAYWLATRQGGFAGTGYGIDGMGAPRGFVATPENRIRQSYDEAIPDR